MKLAYPYVLSERQTKAALAWEGQYKNVLPRISETGYAGVELLAYRSDECDIKGIRKELEKQKLSVVALGTGLIEKLEGLSLVHVDEAMRLKARDEVKRTIRTAAEFDAPVVIGRARGRWQPLGKPELAHSYFREVLEDLLDYAGKHGIGLMLEPQSESASDFINTIDEAMIWCREYSELNLVCDTFHMEKKENDLYQAFRKAEGRIGLVHIADTDRKLPGEGRIDFKNVMTVLTEMSYGGFCSFEVLQTPDPETVCWKSHNSIRKEV